MQPQVKIDGIYLDPLTAAQGDYLNIGIVRRTPRKRVDLWADYQDTPTLRKAQEETA